MLVLPVAAGPQFEARNDGKTKVGLEDADDFCQYFGMHFRDTDVTSSTVQVCCSLMATVRRCVLFSFFSRSQMISSSAIIMEKHVRDLKAARPEADAPKASKNQHGSCDMLISSALVPNFLLKERI